MNETTKKTRYTKGKLFTDRTLHTIARTDAMELNLTRVAAILDDEVRKMCNTKTGNQVYGEWYRELNDRAYKRLLDNIMKQINPKRIAKK